MKIRRLFYFALFVAFIVLTGSGESGEMRSFTDTSGRKIEGTILSGTEATVSIEVSGGKEYTLPIAKFSEADQEFIREWVASHPSQAASFKFDLAETTKRTGREQRKSGDMEVSEEKWVYFLRLRNKSTSESGELELRYRVFVSQAPEGDSKDRPVRTVDGAKGIASLKPNAEAESQTPPVMLTETQLTGAARYADGGRNKKTEKLEGIWVKVFQKGIRIWEIRKGNSPVKEAAWPDEEALKVALDKAEG